MNIQLFPIGSLRMYHGLQNLFPEILNTRDERRETINMQNKPNLLNAQINVSSFITKDYENVHLLGRRKNKPNQTQLQTFCWGCRTEKIMFCNRLNGKCQIEPAGQRGILWDGNL